MSDIKRRNMIARVYPAFKIMNTQTIEHDLFLGLIQDGFQIIAMDNLTDGSDFFRFPFIHKDDVEAIVQEAHE